MKIPNHKPKSKTVPLSSLKRDECYKLPNRDTIYIKTDYTLYNGITCIDTKKGIALAVDKNKEVIPVKYSSSGNYAWENQRRQT